RQNVAERRPGDAGYEHVTGRNASQFALAVDDNRSPGGPADARGVTAQSWMLQPDLVWHVRRLQVQRPRLQQLDALVVERPLDRDGRPHAALGVPQQPADLLDLRAIEARLGGERGRDRLSRRPAPMLAADGVILLADSCANKRAVAAEL